MRASTKISLFGTGLLVVCAGTLMAQETGTRTEQRRGQGQDSNARGAEGTTAGQETRMLIEHAVTMAIGSTTLKGQAEQAGQSGQAGQTGQQAGQSGQQAGQGQTGSNIDPAQQLMIHARRGMQESQRLLQGAGREQGSAQRLQTAATNYINTLFALCGESTTRGAGAAGSSDAANDTGRARTGRSAKDEDLGAGQAGRSGKTLSARDKAAVALINHSVCEVIEGTHMTHMLHSKGAGASSSATELLQRHAREMTAEGRETLQRFLGSSQTGGSGAGNADRSRSGRTGARRSDDDQPNAGRDANAAGGQEGEASVTSLARRGQELIEAIQSSGQGGAQGGSERSGASRRDRDGTSSDSGRSSNEDRSSGSGRSGRGRSSGADRETNPR